VKPFISLAVGIILTVALFCASACPDHGAPVKPMPCHHEEDGKSPEEDGKGPDTSCIDANSILLLKAIDGFALPATASTAVPPVLSPTRSSYVEPIIHASVSSLRSVILRI
jgi:hypothetical protein